MRRHARGAARPRRPPRPQSPLTPLQTYRMVVMHTAPAGVVTQARIRERVKSRGVDVSHTTVSAVLFDRFRNPDVEAAFCELTGADPIAAFPDDPTSLDVQREAAERTSQLVLRSASRSA